MTEFSCNQDIVDTQQSRREGPNNKFSSGMRAIIKSGAVLGISALSLNTGTALAQNGSGQLYLHCESSAGNPGLWDQFCQGLQGGTGPYHQYAAQCFQLENAYIGYQLDFCENFPQPQ